VQLLAVLLALVASVPGLAQPPRRDLAADERCGGHTLARHVGKTNRELADRLRQEPDIAAASTYPDRPTAETVVGAALDKERSRIAAWSKRSGPRPNLALRYASPGDRPIGRSWQRGKIAPNSCTQAVVVLRWDVSRGAFCVLTSYPEVAR
jgi:hypothetical protein